MLLSLVAPRGAKGAVGQIAWPTVLLICGIVTYVGLMQDQDVPGWLGENVAALGLPLIAALLICYIGGVVSAFASTTGILGALIPLAVPFLQGDDAVGAIGLITALALSSSIVDSSPFSTSGALVVANATEAERDRTFKNLMVWGFSMVAIDPAGHLAALRGPRLAVSPARSTENTDATAPRRPPAAGAQSRSATMNRPPAGLRRYA